jgi:hypothetical protein
MPAPSKTDGRETRAITTALEMRAAGDGEARTAVAMPRCSTSRPTSAAIWTEEIKPGAFERSLARSTCRRPQPRRRPRRRPRWRRHAQPPRGREGPRLREQLPDTSDGRDLVVSIDRGDIAGMSFGFTTRKQEWDETVDPPHRTILEADLYEITYTAFRYTPTRRRPPVARGRPPGAPRAQQECGLEPHRRPSGPPGPDRARHLAYPASAGGGRQAPASRPQPPASAGFFMSRRLK